MKYNSVLLIVLLPLCAAGQSIKNGDGTLFERSWCHADTAHLIVGDPVGGVFRGCGVINEQGNWYFNPVAAAASATAFPYQCFLTYELPGNAGLVSELITINTPVIANGGEDVISCSEEVSFTAHEKYAGVYHYTWETIDGSIRRDGKTVSLPVRKKDTFVLTMVDAATGCSGRDTINVTYENLDVQIVADRDTVCLHTAMELEAFPQELSYKWFDGDALIGEGASVKYIPFQAGRRALTLAVQGDYCTDTLFRTVNVVDFKLELLVDDGSVTRGEEIVLTPRANDPFEVVAWMPEGMFPRQDAAVQRVVIKDNDTFRVVGVSSFGCVDTAALFIAVTPDVFVPNVFSPNADGRNDYFRVKSISEPVKIISFVVFDRWGKEVWSASGPMAARGWDGTRNGAPSKAGTYFFYLEAEGSISNYRLRKKGDVLLVR